mmetsp:Transcript_28310/g.111167  ORF Transcript_28310/g.111167 Transcript_28310/m.111167 type:complete len:121 (-) Transcript_28310:1178-1540(-)
MSIFRGIRVARNCPEVAQTKKEDCEILGGCLEAPSGCSQPAIADVEELERTRKLSSHAFAAYGSGLKLLKKKDIYDCSEEELAAEDQKNRGHVRSATITTRTNRRPYLLEIGHIRPLPVG